MKHGHLLVNAANGYYEVKLNTRLVELKSFRNFKRRLRLIKLAEVKPAGGPCNA